MAGGVFNIFLETKDTIFISTALPFRRGLFPGRGLVRAVIGKTELYAPGSQEILAGAGLAYGVGHLVSVGLPGMEKTSHYPKCSWEPPHLNMRIP